MEIRVVGNRYDIFVRAYRPIPREFVETLAGGGIEIVSGPFDRHPATDVLPFLDAFRPVPGAEAPGPESTST